jgi:hypothetical protein
LAAQQFIIFDMEQLASTQNKREQMTTPELLVPLEPQLFPRRR